MAEVCGGEEWLEECTTEEEREERVVSHCYGIVVEVFQFFLTPIKMTILVIRFQDFW